MSTKGSNTTRNPTRPDVYSDKNWTKLDSESIKHVWLPGKKTYSTTKSQAQIYSCLQDSCLVTFLRPPSSGYGMTLALLPVSQAWKPHLPIGPNHLSTNVHPCCSELIAQLTNNNWNSQLTYTLHSLLYRPFGSKNIREKTRKHFHHKIRPSFTKVHM